MSDINLYKVEIYNPIKTRIYLVITDTKEKAKEKATKLFHKHYPLHTNLNILSPKCSNNISSIAVKKIAFEDGIGIFV